MRLLVVDDNQDITDLLTFYCKEQEIDCKVVQNGKEGLEAIRNEEFNLILLDVAMPYFSGIDVINSLRKDGLVETNNIVIFTASSDYNILEELKDNGVKEILNKPTSINELTTLIEKYRPNI